MVAVAQVFPESVRRLAERAKSPWRELALRDISRAEMSASEAISRAERCDPGVAMSMFDLGTSLADLKSRLGEFGNMGWITPEEEGRASAELFMYHLDAALKVKEKLAGCLPRP